MSNTNKEADVIGEPQAFDGDYVDVIQSNVSYEKKFTTDPGEPTKIIYYCRDCQALTTPKRVGKKLKFTCSACKGKEVSFGTENSLGNYYKGVPKKEVS